MRILVCGGRSFTARATLERALDALHAKHPLTELIHGDARGADSMAATWALRRGIKSNKFNADWSRYGRSAGPIRNAQMLEEGKPDLVVYFPGGSGTGNMISQAFRAGVEVVDALTYLEK